MVVASVNEEAALLSREVSFPGSTPKSPGTSLSRLSRQFNELVAKNGMVRVFLAVFVTVSWMFVSSMLILVNKHILKDLGFAYPFAVSSMGMLGSSLLSQLVVRWLKLTEAKAVITRHYYAQRMLPVGLFMACTLWTGNRVYLYLSVSFIQMLKAFTPVITMACLFLAKLEQPSMAMVLSVLVIAMGTVMSAYGEVHLSVIGMLLMFSSELTESLRLVMTQYLLKDLKMGPFEGVMYLAPACFVWLTLGSALVEWGPMVASGALTTPARHPLLFLLSGCLGFAVNVLAYASIKLASSLTLKVLGTVKNALLIVVMMLLFGEHVTPLQGAGYFISVLAFGNYTRLKVAQIAAAPQ